MEDRTNNGRKYRLLNIIDEYTRECLCIHVGRRMTAEDVQEVLTELFCIQGIPEYIRSDNGSEFTAKRIMTRLGNLCVHPLYIEPVRY